MQGLAIFVRETSSSSLLNLLHVALEAIGIYICSINIINMYAPLTDDLVFINDLDFAESRITSTRL